MGQDLFLSRGAAARIRAEIARARGNEVCFVASVAEDGGVIEPRVVARGHRTAVLAAVRGAEPGSIVIHNHPSGELTPSDPDLEVAAELYEMGVGLAITDNEARELYVVVEPRRTREYTRLGEAEIAALLAPGGPIGRWHGAYEDRPTQRAMAELVARSYNEGGVALVEAGTGTGKSIAYLVPAIQWAVANRERTIVSTNTINLQEQLVGKDLPFLRRALGTTFRFAMVKGRRNYVSIRRARLAAAQQAQLFEGAQRAELDAIVEWLRGTRDGSLQDLPFEPSAEVWDEVASESDVCLRARCPHFEECFYQRSRRDAAGADVLVVNHHLLFSDLAVRRAQGNYAAPAVLPPYRRVILDEAHNLEDAATAHLGAAVSRRGMFRMLARLDRRGRGILAAIEERLRAGRDDLLQQDALQRIASDLRPQVERLRERAAELFSRLEAAVARTEDGTLRLDSNVDAVPGLEVPLEGVLVGVAELARGLDRLRESLQVDTRWQEALTEQLLELDAVAGRLRAMGEGVRLALEPGQETLALVRWVERRGGGGGKEPNVAVHAAPVDLSEALRDALFERVDTAVLASATLATRDGFEFLRGRIGLTGGGIRLAEAIFPSPFDFESQTLVVVPTDLPEPRGEQHAAYDRATADVVEDLAELSDGGVFVLFTSYRSLRTVATELRRRRIDGRWPLFVQGERPRSQILAEFVRSGRGILFGVSSFWEGVDVPGDPLRALVLAKLPFKVPSEPLTAARLEAVGREGGNPFQDFMLPHAALRLKQGFGRLIRSRGDRGAVVLLDRRVMEKGYGRYLLDSLPPAPIRVGSWGELRGEVGRFYAASEEGSQVEG